LNVNLIGAVSDAVVVLSMVVDGVEDVSVKALKSEIDVVAVTLDPPVAAMGGGRSGVEMVAVESSDNLCPWILERL
jgi:hypothetical protein